MRESGKFAPFNKRFVVGIGHNLHKFWTISLNFPQTLHNVAQIWTHIHDFCTHLWSEVFIFPAQQIAIYGNKERYWKTRAFDNDDGWTGHNSRLSFGPRFFVISVNPLLTGTIYNSITGFADDCFSKVIQKIKLCKSFAMVLFK